MAELQRERLLRAIIACSAKRGYQSTTIADIVALAKTSRSAFYDHFENKEACFLAAYAQMSAAMQETVVASGLDAPDWEHALDLGMRTYFEWFRERHDQAAAFLVEIRTVGPEALKARAEVLERMSGRLKLLGLRAREEDPSLPELDDVAYASLIVTADELAHDYVRQGKADRLDELIEPIQYLARLVFAGPAAALG